MLYQIVEVIDNGPNAGPGQRNILCQTDIMEVHLLKWQGGEDYDSGKYIVIL